MTTPSLQESLLEQRAAIRGMVAAAARAISPHYPLETFIARNPVADYERLPFEEAVRALAAEHGAGLTHSEEAFRVLHQAGRIHLDDLRAAIDFHVAEARSSRILCCGEKEMTVAELLLLDLLHAPAETPSPKSLRTPAEALAPRVQARVDESVSRWLSALVGDPAWSAGWDEGDLWATWRRLAPHDLRLPRRVRSGIRSAPSHPEDAIVDVLAEWGWDDDVAERCIRAHVLAQPGWAATIRHTAASGDSRVSMTALVAIRMTLESLLLGPREADPEVLGYTEAGSGRTAFPTAPRLEAVAAAAGVALDDDGVRDALARVLSLVDDASRRLIWQEAYERGVARPLTPAVAPVLRPVEPEPFRPLAQAVFCIDPRSEGIRRHLERAGEVQTLGFAGFFAVPIAYTSAAGGPAISSCPVLLTPRRALTESSSDRQPLARWQARLAAGHALRETAGRVKESTVAPFAFAETAGYLMGPAMAARTLAPSGWAALRQRIARLLPQKPATRLDADVAMDLDERALYAEAALRMMGLVDGFARIVLLAGHGAHVTNNPYASALQCGACGGHEGEPNARAAALVFNDPATRARLAARGIRIPDDTLFVAAQHDTVSDVVRLLEPWAIPATHDADVARLLELLAAARARNLAERVAALPGGGGRRATEEAERRAADWAEVYPEWGLVGNAAFIVGPRTITAGHDLGRRAFLHSYDAAADPDGSGLETILTAPMIVAQWINAQYAASALNPDRFGSGPKPLHNVVGTTGVLSGYSGDLRIGLPWQSVGTGRELVHEPVRLQVFVQAPFARLNHLLETAEVVRELVEKGWITLRAREHDTDRWLRYGSYGWEEEPVPVGLPAADSPVPTTENLEMTR